MSSSHYANPESRDHARVIHVQMYWTVLNKWSWRLAVSQEWAKNILWNQKVMKVHTYVKCLWMCSSFCWLLGPYSHHHLTKIITICGIGWFGIFTGKTQRWRCIWIHVLSGSWLFLSLALSKKLFKSFSCHRLINGTVESTSFIQL